jgi:hypothetical protein
MIMTCAACGVEVELPEKVGFRDICTSCDAWLHSCVNCGLWVNSLCTEPSAERIRDPEGMNYCDWFRVRTQDAARSTQEERASGGKEAAEEMWRKLTKNKKEE